MMENGNLKHIFLGIMILHLKTDLKIWCTIYIVVILDNNLIRDINYEWKYFRRFYFEKVTQDSNFERLVLRQCYSNFEFNFESLFLASYTSSSYTS